VTTAPGPVVRRITAIALLALGVACTNPPASGALTQAPTRAPGNSTVDCPDIDLRSPSGERIDLTGTWETEREGTRAGIYFLHQVGDCLWFAGGLPSSSETPDSEPPLGWQTVVFQGRVGSDFVVTGRWIDVRYEGIGGIGSGGNITLRIEFGEQPGELRLVYVGGSGQPFVEPGYREEQSWIKISDAGAYPPSSPAP
jgi:hypothetical protein